MKNDTLNDTPVSSYKIAEKCGVSRPTVMRWRKKGYIPVSMNDTQVSLMVSFINKKGDIKQFKSHLERVSQNDTPSDTLNDTLDTPSDTLNDTQQTKSVEEQEKKEGITMVSLLEKQLDVKDGQIKSQQNTINNLNERLKHEQVLLKQEQDKNTLLLEAPPVEPVEQGGMDTGTRVLIATMLVMIGVFAVLVMMTLQ